MIPKQQIFVCWRNHLKVEHIHFYNSRVSIILAAKTQKQEHKQKNKNQHNKKMCGMKEQVAFVRERY